MPLILATSATARRHSGKWRWLSVGDKPTGLNPQDKMRGLAEQLEAGWDASLGDSWLVLGKTLAQDITAGLAHTPASVFNATDFGQALVWSKLVLSHQAATESILCVCDDPWIFRHLAASGVETTGPFPGLFLPSLKLKIRGYLARTKKALELVRSHLQLRRQAALFNPGSKVLLVYGHPESGADGVDGYFGPLMLDQPELVRLLHVDCSPDRARVFEDGGRTFSLHAWGSLGFILRLPFLKWRPRREFLQGEYGWLVRRSAENEGGTAQAAAIAWQSHCQSTWLKRCRPRLVAWPWENHSWERSFVRAARRLGVDTVGYQHSVVGVQAINYSGRSNADGLESIPDLVLASGRMMRDRLIEMGLPTDRVRVAGALRVRTFQKLNFNRDAPIYVALPFDGDIGAEMLEAVRQLNGSGKKFLVKPHPMTPLAFDEAGDLIKTFAPLAEAGPLSGVIYAATTVGPEAILGGLPTYRFLSAGKLAIDVLPPGIHTRTISLETVNVILSDTVCVNNVSQQEIFSSPDPGIWHGIFDGEGGK